MRAHHMVPAKKMIFGSNKKSLKSFTALETDNAMDENLHLE